MTERNTFSTVTAKNVYVNEPWTRFSDFSGEFVRSSEIVKLSDDGTIMIACDNGFAIYNVIYDSNNDIYSGDIERCSFVYAPSGDA